MKQQHPSLPTELTHSSEPKAKLYPLNAFLKELGVSSITGWRWRKRRWLSTVNIAGRQYITEAQMAEFTRRAEAGEFEELSNTTDN